MNKFRTIYMAILLGAFLSWRPDLSAAVLCDGSNDYVDITASAGVTDFPDGDFTLAIWYKPTSNAGTDSRALLSTTTSDFPTSGFVSWYIYSDTFATTALRGEMELNAGEDGNTSSITVTTTNNPFTSNTNENVVAWRRSGSTFSLWVNGVQDGSVTNADFDAITPNGGVRLCATFNLSAGRFLNGTEAEVAFWQRALSDGELASMGQHKFSPNCFPGRSWYAPFIGGQYVERAKGLTVTNNGTVSAPHPRLYSCN